MVEQWTGLDLDNLPDREQRTDNIILLKILYRQDEGAPPTIGNNSC